MKTKFSFFIAIIMSFFSCNQQEQQPTYNSFAPKVVEAKGYIVPKDSMATPKAVPAGKPKVVMAGKPKVVRVKTNIHLAGIPKIVIAGTPKFVFPVKTPSHFQKWCRPLTRLFLQAFPKW
jgi:hypothetical protein